MITSPREDRCPGGSGRGVPAGAADRQLLDQPPVDWVLVELTLVGCHRRQNAEDQDGDEEQRQQESANDDRGQCSADDLRDRVEDGEVERLDRAVLEPLTAILEHEIDDQGANETEERNADVSQGRPQLLVARRKWLLTDRGRLARILLGRRILLSGGILLSRGILLSGGILLAIGRRLLTRGRGLLTVRLLTERWLSLRPLRLLPPRLRTLRLLPPRWLGRGLLPLDLLRGGLLRGPRLVRIRGRMSRRGALRIC
jgi:hypothetical protein